jgi:type IV pilus assembly protein PilE
MKRSQHGFTLIEILIALVILGILVTIAIPSYRTYSRQGKLMEAQGLLSAQRLRLEQSYQDNRTFVGACAAGTGTALNQGRFFTLACSSLTATTYTVTATGVGAMAGFVFTVNQDNARATTAVPGGWATSATCWVSAPSGC